MTVLRTTCLPLLAVLAATAMFPDTAPPADADTRLCTLEPGRTLAVVRVEQDTTLPFASAAVEPRSMSGVRPGAGDSLLASPSTPMPAARVRLLQLDSASRATFAAHGITDSQPIAFIRAAPYRADCRTLRWTDTVPFTRRGEVGYLRATLAPRERWIGDVPLLVIPDVWNYPYPRRRGLAYGLAADAPLAPAAAMFDLNVVLEMPRPASAEAHVAANRVRRDRAITWARANPTSAELEPVRSLVRRSVLEADWEVARQVTSRLRGTYRVELEVGGERSTWFFRTHDRAASPWRSRDALQTTSDLLASPHILGYRLTGHVAGSVDSLPNALPRDPRNLTFAWLATTDRPTAPGNDVRRTLSGVLEFFLAATPEGLWDDLEPLVPRSSARDSAMAARMNLQIPRDRKQPHIPLTVRLDTRGGIRADTTLVVGGRTLRVALERLDTLSVRRGY